MPLVEEASIPALTFISEEHLALSTTAIKSSCVRLLLVELHAAHNNCRLSGVIRTTPGTWKDMVDRHVPKREQHLTPIAFALLYPKQAYACTSYTAAARPPIIPSLRCLGH